MSDQDKHKLPIELLGVAGRLETERPHPTDLELDRIKLRAMARAGRASSRRRGHLRRSRRFASMALAVVLLGGGGAIVAKQDPAPTPGSWSAAAKQYCPPSSQQPNNPKDPGPSKCGNPKTK
jgi:hypothetical protein